MRPEDFYLRKRMTLLRALAYAAPLPFVAMIGANEPLHILALAKGARRAHPLRTRLAPNSVVCYCWCTGRRRTMEALIEHEEYVRHRRRRVKGPSRLPFVVRFVEANGSRDPWIEDVKALRQRTGARFGLVCHCGVGDRSSVRADLDAVLPMFDGRGTVVLLAMERPTMQAVLKGMVRTGWSGVWHQDMGVAQLQRLPVIQERHDGGDNL